MTKATDKTADAAMMRIWKEFAPEMPWKQESEFYRVAQPIMRELADVRKTEPYPGRIWRWLGVGNA